MRLRTSVPFPVHIVSAGNIREDAIVGGSGRAGRFAAIPWLIHNPDGSDGMGRRQCTAHYKGQPIHRKIVELHGGKRPKGGTKMRVGISTDESLRVKPSRVQYIVNDWPLIRRRMNHGDCHAKLASDRWSAPKSSCIGFRFRSDAQWHALKPDEMADVTVVDRTICRQSGIKDDQFMQRSRRSLDEVDLRSFAEYGQTDLFLNECEGVCGV